jgi:hypothetical protein
LAISDYSVALELDMRNGGANNEEGGDNDNVDEREDFEND